LLLKLATLDDLERVITHSVAHNVYLS